MKTSPAGLTFIKQWESCRLQAYQDGVGVWTIGWGHTGPDVHEGLVIDQARADALFQEDVDQRDMVLNRWFTVPMEQHQWDAVCSCLYNVGSGRPDPNGRDGIIWLRSGRHSTLFRCLMNQDWANAALEFPKWKEPVNLPGILRRRLAEQAMFLGQVGGNG